MTRIGNTYSRTSTQMSSTQLLLSLRRTQQELLDTQAAISSGKQVDQPSDAPGKLSAILRLTQQLEARVQQDRNLSHLVTILNNVDQALGDAGSVAREAHTVALSQIGVGSDTGTRKAEASVVDGQINALLTILNRRVQDVGLFAGNVNGAGEPFVSFLGGVRYLGGTSNLQTDAGQSRLLGFNSNGVESLGALSGRIVGQIDLNPQAAAATLLSNLDGALGFGVRTGTVRLEVDGVQTQVDLGNANTMGDVVLRIQQAIDNLDPAAGSLAIGNNGFQLTAAAGHNITIGDFGPGQTATDLGIAVTAGSGQTVAGADLNPRLDLLTSLSSLGVNIDWAGGLKITQGDTTRIADFSSARNVQDLVNVIDRLNLGLRLTINDAGDGLNLVSEVSGIDLTVGENSGGTTAGDLGLRTFGLETELVDFNRGLGVQRTQDQDDLEIQLHDGRTFRVNLDSALTVRDVITTIRAAAADAGLSAGDAGDAGTDFNIGLASDGNGLLLQDQTVGGASFRVAGINQSLAAADLGIAMDAGTASAIQGDDVAVVQVNSVFTHLRNLQQALLNDDSRGIALAADRLQEDANGLTQSRAVIGIRTREAEQALERSTDMKIAEETMLSDLQEGDLTDLIVRFTQLQQQLQASLSVGAQNLQLSLMDFLR